ncbi:MAG: LysM peptidoglycan-binding domain-containing protein, partial [Thermoflexia bacterium]
VTPTPSLEEMADLGMVSMMAEAGQTQTPMVTESPLASPTEAPTSAPVSEETPPAPEPTPAPTPVPTPSVVEVFPTPAGETQPQPVVTEPSAAAGEVTYVVQPGDRLFRIALRFGVDYRALAAYNNILNPDRIYPGQVLRIPQPGIFPTPSAPSREILYTVQPGDNLFRIALRYNMNYLYLAAYNNIPNPHQIRVGQVIRIPVNP